MPCLVSVISLLTHSSSYRPPLDLFFSATSLRPRQPLSKRRRARMALHRISMNRDFSLVLIEKPMAVYHDRSRDFTRF